MNIGSLLNNVSLAWVVVFCTFTLQWNHLLFEDTPPPKKRETTYML